MVCVRRIICGGQDRDIIYFYEEHMDEQKEVSKLVMT